MLDRVPDALEITNLLGQSLYAVWTHLRAFIDARYDMEQSWNSGGKSWIYEYKYRRGGKTLCSFCMRQNCLGFMVIFGKDEKAKFEADRDLYSQNVLLTYDSATTYHDGKWVMFTPVDDALFPDFERMLLIKRKPNRK